MPLSCGCEIQGGAPVTPEMLKAHYKHTFEALLFWELLHRPQNPLDPEKRIKLSEARLNLINAIDELYPEASKD